MATGSFYLIGMKLEGVEGKDRFIRDKMIKLMFGQVGFVDQKLVYKRISKIIFNSYSHGTYNYRNTMCESIKISRQVSLKIN